MRITIFGTGSVGLVTGTSLAEVGNGVGRSRFVAVEREAVAS